MIDPTRRDSPGVEVEAVKDGKVVASATTATDGTFALPAKADGGVQLRLPAQNFRSRSTGSTGSARRWSPRRSSASYIWMWAGFAMVLIAAGLAACRGKLLEAARVDGANEWQVFRRVTVPLLAPVLAVVAGHADDQRAEDLRPGLHHRAGLLAGRRQRARPGAVPQGRPSATDADQGIGSAIAVFLLLLVLPVMLLQHPPAPEGGSDDDRTTTGCPRRGRRTAAKAHRRRPGSSRRRQRRRSPSSCSLVGLFWLVPTIGLLLVLAAQHRGHERDRLVEGLHRALPAHRSTATAKLLDNSDITGSLSTRC